MPKLIACLYTLLLTAIIQAQSVTGRVTDATNNQPLVGTVVMSALDSTITDDNGRFTLNATDIIKAQYVGYETLSVKLNNNKTVNISMTPSSTTLGEVIISSGTGGHSIISSPISVNFITRKMYLRDHPFSVTQAINRVPGVYMHSGTFNTNRITIRGIGSRTLYGTNKIKAYFDEIPLTDGSGNSTIEDIDQELIERIEVIKGPNSSLYGAGLGGTVRLLSVKPVSMQTSVNSGFTVGSFGTSKLNTTVRYDNSKTAFTLSFSDLSSNGYRENSDYNRSQIGLSGRQQVSTNGWISLLGVFTRMKAFIPSSISRDAFENNPESAAFTWAQSKGYESYDKGLFGITYGLQLPNLWALKATIFGNYRDAYEPRPFDILDEQTTTIGTRAILSKRLTRFDVELGYEIFVDRYRWKNFENDYDETTNGSVQGAQLTDNTEHRNYANLFTELSFELMDELHVTGGLNFNQTRYKIEDHDHNTTDNISGSYDFDAVLSPKIGLVYDMNDHASFLNISHGFSPPSLEETLYPSGHINPNIKPESGWNYEIGLRGSTRNFEYDLTAYFMEIKNLLVAQRVDEDRYIGVNAGLNHHLGVDLLLNYTLLNKTNYSINLFTSASYMDFSFVDFTTNDTNFDGNQLTGVPKVLLNPGIELMSESGLYGNINGQYVGEIPIDNGNSIYSDDYFILRSKFGYRWSGQHWHIDMFAGVDNITNAKYASMLLINATGFNGAQPRYYYPGNPINYFTGLTLGYKW